MRICFIFCVIVGAMMTLQAKTQQEQVRLESVEIGGVDVPLIFEQNNTLPVGSVQLSFIGGAADAKKLGLAAMSAKILNEGTSKDGNVGFAKKLESKAIDLSASAGLQGLTLELSYLKEYQNDAFMFLDELLSDPNLSEASLQKQKSLTLSKIASREDDFDDVAEKKLNTILFRGTPLEYPLIGTPQSVESITIADVREFLEANLALERLIIVAGGDMNLGELKAKLQILSKLPRGEKKSRLHFNVSDKAEVVHTKKPTKQAFIYFGAPFDVKDSEKNYIARVESFILGGSGFGSRMMEEVRVKRGLAYSAYMRINVGGAADYASGFLQTKLESKDEAVAVVRQVVDDFVKNGASEAELQAAKNFLLGSEPLRNETLAARLNSRFSNYFRGLPLDYNKRELEKIKSLTLEELNNYIKEHGEILKMSFSIVEE